MSDGFYEQKNRLPSRGYKLRDEYENLYSGPADYLIGNGSLNTRQNATEDQHHPQLSGKKLRGDTGLIIKEPMS